MPIDILPEIGGMVRKLVVKGLSGGGEMKRMMPGQQLPEDEKGKLINYMS